MQFCFLKDDKEPERNESTTLILQLTTLKCSCLHIMRHHHAFFVYTDFCKENRLKLTLLLCTAVWNKVDFWFRRKDRHDKNRVHEHAWVCSHRTWAVLQVPKQKAPCCSCPQRSVSPSNMAHTSFLITLAQTNTAMRTANPPTVNASTESQHLFKHKLLLRHPFMGLFSYLWPLGRKDALKTSATVCLQR